MWKVNPKVLCRQHLLGEHLECHMFVGSINKRKNLSGYLEKGLLEIHNLKNRHDELSMEMENRGYEHDSPLPDFEVTVCGHIDVENNIEELKQRCKDCRERILNQC